jgi:hypothetical protein
VTGDDGPCRGEAASCVAQGDDEPVEGDGGPGEGGEDLDEGDDGLGGIDGGGDGGAYDMGDEGAAEETTGDQS